MTFAELFVGGDQAHGLWDERRGAKTERGPATPERYAEHLAGKLGLGLVPVRRDGTCRFAAIDIDIDSINHVALLQKVLARKLPLAVFRSKSGAAHLLLFMQEPGLAAATVIQTLKKWATLLGYPAAEIFPKQTKVTKKNLGNWINLPFFGDEKTSRYAIGPRGALTLTEFLASVEFYDPATCRVDESPAAEPAEPAAPEVPIETDGEITEGRRNETLTKAAGAMRRHGLAQDAIEAALLAHNRKRCEPPLPERDIVTIAASVARYDPTAERRHLTDVGNAERLVERYGPDLRYDHKRKRWFIWNGSYFRRDEKGRIERRARDTARAIFREVAIAEDAGRRDKLAKWAMRSEAKERQQALVTLARSWPEVAVLPAEFDDNPWLLNCRNGTLDLRAGTLREARRADLISKVVPVVYDPAAECPLFLRFLDRVMRGRSELVAYLRRLAGYWLTGSTRERCIFVGYGAQGSNGKTTFAEVFHQLLGDYAQVAATRTFLEQQNESVRDDLAQLPGVRLVCAAEAPENQRLAEALIKVLAGGEDYLRARALFGEYFEFKPAGKLLMMVNHKPVIRGTEDAIWDRIHLLPFDVRIPREEQDRELLTKLRGEFPGILAWAVRGCREWRERGLDPPGEVRGATREYRVEMDRLGAYLTERCLVGPEARVGIGELHADYVEWCGSDWSFGRTNFGARLKERGFRQDESHKVRRWIGLGLLEQEGARSRTLLPASPEGRDEL